MPLDLAALYQQCAPSVAPSTLAAIIQTESRYQPWAINVNGGWTLARQPKSRAEAETWAAALITRGYNVDLGAMQINSSNLDRLGLSLRTAFDPCLNLAGGAALLTDAYNRAFARYGADTRAALSAALSAYNTGDFERGIANGYVARVRRAAAEPMPVPPIDAEPPIERRAPGASTYAVQKDDTAFSIAKRFHVTVAALAAVNHLNERYDVDVGAVLTIPPADPSSAEPVRLPPAKPDPRRADPGVASFGDDYRNPQPWGAAPPPPSSPPPPSGESK
jgi:type IV secretion system protein VirB1